MNSNLNLGLLLREDLIHHLVIVLSYLNGKEMNLNEKKKLKDYNDNLIKRISILSDEIKETELRNSPEIDNNLLEDINLNKKKIFFKLNLEQKLNIISILIKNLNVIFWPEDSMRQQEDSKSQQDHLIKENNELISVLLNLHRSQSRIDNGKLF